MWLAAGVLVPFKQYNNTKFGHFQNFGCKASYAKLLKSPSSVSRAATPAAPFAVTVTWTSTQLCSLEPAAVFWNIKASLTLHFVFYRTVTAFMCHVIHFTAVVTDAGSEPETNLPIIGKIGCTSWGSCTRVYSSWAQGLVCILSLCLPEVTASSHRGKNIHYRLISNLKCL